MPLEPPAAANTSVPSSAEVERWRRALADTCASIHAKLAAAANACARADDPASDWRVWSFDVSRSTGAKCFIAAPTAVFIDAYLGLAPPERHAYECIGSSQGCFAYFDLDAVITSGEDEQRACVSAANVASASVAVLRELSGAQSINVETLVLDATRPNKFSQHLVLHSMSTRCC